MQFNTALCFIACGMVLLVFNTRLGPLAGSVLGTTVALVGALTLLEYIAAMDLGIDQFLHRPYFEVATAFPGRMAPLTAFCFLFVGIAFGFGSAGRRRPKALVAAGLMVCVVGVIGLVALLGYLTGTDSAYGWGAYSRMAFNTSVAFVLIGAGLFMRCWQSAMRQNCHFLHWVPIVASITLIVMAAVISVATVASLRSALNWRQHTYEVILVAESLRAGAKDLQRGMQGYLLSGTADSLAPYASASRSASRQLAQIRKLTRDNPGQQERIGQLSVEMGDLMASTERVIDQRRDAGTMISARLGSEEGTQQAFDRVAALIDTIIQEEHRLLVQRSAIAEVEFHDAAHLLGFGCVMAAAFLTTGSLGVRREIRRRHQVELDLHKANDEMKILGGLLPMCAQCKSIRDDRGYWNQLEAYLQEHSEATFSHGLCENCVRLLYPEIADQVLSKMSAAAAVRAEAR